MIQILISAGVALTVSILLTPVLIRLFTRQGFGHEIREDGPPSHRTKRGTPSMGGVAIVAGIWGGYLAAHLAGLSFHGAGPSASGLLVLALASALGVVGFIDDLIKIRLSRNLGLNKTTKTVGQVSAAVIFAVLALGFRDADGLTPAASNCPMCARSPPSPCRCWCSSCSVWYWSAPGPTPSTSPTASTGWPPVRWRWSARCMCSSPSGSTATPVRSPRVGLLQRARPAGPGVRGGGHRRGVHRVLWWNAAPAKIFMGDTGSLALGGIIAGLSVTSHTEILAVVLGALFVAEIASVVIQIVAYRTTGRRVFRMAPFHHHFELLGWAETTVIIRFWLLTAIACGLGVALFYGEWFATVGD